MIDEQSEFEEFPDNYKPDNDFTILKKNNQSELFKMFSKQGLELSFKVAKKKKVVKKFKKRGRPKG